MNDKRDDKSRAESAPESNSQELFNEIFTQATMEIRIEKRGKAQTDSHTPVLARGRWQPQNQLRIPKRKDSQAIETSRLSADLAGVAASLVGSGQ
jgi:hypothetical protein